MGNTEPQPRVARSQETERNPAERVHHPVRRKRRRADLNAEHRAKPQVLADALVNHLFVHAATTFVCGMWSDREVFVAEHAPHTEDLEAFRFVRIDQELISHDVNVDRCQFMGSKLRPQGPSGTQSATVCAA